MKSTGCNSCLSRSLALLERLEAGHGIRDPIDSIERVELDRGGRVVLTLASKAGLAWFRSDGDGIERLRPEADLDVPLAGQLPSLRGGASVRVISYRPGRRIVLRRDDGGARQFLKGFRRRRSRAAAAAHGEAALDTGRFGFRVAPLIEHDPELDTLTFAPMGDGSAGAVPILAETFFLIGTALRLFQDRVPVAPLELHGPDSELRVLDEFARKVTTALGALPPGWRGLRDRLASCCGAVPEAPCVRTHRDLHDGQFQDVDERVGLLDFDLLCLADSALDPANLTVHLQLRALQQAPGASEKAIHSSARALLDGLDRFDEPGFQWRFRFYQAASSLRLALIYRLRPRWQHLTGALVGFADRCLTDIDGEDPLA